MKIIIISEKKLDVFENKLILANKENNVLHVEPDFINGVYLAKVFIG